LILVYYLLKSYFYFSVWPILKLNIGFYSAGAWLSAAWVVVCWILAGALLVLGRVAGSALSLFVFFAFLWISGSLGGLAVSFSPITFVVLFLPCLVFLVPSVVG
jgi:hypothetical protein